MSRQTQTQQNPVGFHSTGEKHGCTVFFNLPELQTEGDLVFSWDCLHSEANCMLLRIFFQLPWFLQFFRIFSHELASARLFYHQLRFVIDPDP